MRINARSHTRCRLCRGASQPTLIQLNHIYDAQLEMEKQSQLAMPRSRGRQGATVTWQESQVTTSATSSRDATLRRSQSHGSSLRSSGGRRVSSGGAVPAAPARSAAAVAQEAAQRALQGEVSALTNQLAAATEAQSKV